MKLYFEIDLDKINELQEDSLRRAIQKSKGASYTDIAFRINGKQEVEEADWIKHLTEINICGVSDGC